MTISEKQMHLLQFYRLQSNEESARWIRSLSDLEIEKEWLAWIAD